MNCFARQSLVAKACGVTSKSIKSLGLIGSHIQYDLVAPSEGSLWVLKQLFRLTTGMSMEFVGTPCINSQNVVELQASVAKPVGESPQVMNDALSSFSLNSPSLIRCKRNVIRWSF